MVGTVFLLFQILFAINNYGPQHIPVLDLIFEKPWLGNQQQANHAAATLSSAPFAMQDITAGSGLEAFARAPFDDKNPSYLEVMGGGVAVGDYNGDGWEDLFFTGMPSIIPNQHAEAELTSASALFRNKKGEGFEKVTVQAGLSNIKGHPQGALFWDYDNNGTQDLYVAAYDGGQLFRNVNGNFEDITEASGLSLEQHCGALPCFVSSATAADFNRDGHLDLLLVNNVEWDINDPAHRGEHNLFPAFFDPQPTLLFRNNGDGTFTDVSAESGILNERGKGLSAVWTDINLDGWPDVYIANDLSPNRFYVNNKDGSFTELASGMHLDEIKSSMGIAAADVDNDGDWDLATTNLKGTKLSLFENIDDFLFEHATDRLGLSSTRATTGWGLSFVDLDLDGYLDLVMAGGPVWEDTPMDTKNLFYRNLGNGRFENIGDAITVTSANSVSRGVAVMDFDQSGTPDLVIANTDASPPQLLKNNSAATNNRLKLKLRGIVSNRDAIGARVILVRKDGVRQMQEVRAGDSYQSSGSKALFFGLGKSAADSLMIHWPSGGIDTLYNIPLNRTLQITESTSTQ